MTVNAVEYNMDIPATCERTAPLTCLTEVCSLKFLGKKAKAKSRLNIVDRINVLRLMENDDSNKKRKKTSPENLPPNTQSGF